MPQPEFDMDPNKTALLIIDMQRYLVDPLYGLAKAVYAEYPAIASYFYARLAQMVIPNNVKLLQFFRRNQFRVIYLTIGPELPDGSDLSFLMKLRVARRERQTGSKSIYPKGTVEHSIIEELKPEKGELVINKTSAGAFNSSNIDHVLRNMGIEGLVITGVATDMCVETTARDAADRGYKCILVDDACATLDPAFHDATLVAFGREFGKIKSTDEVIAELRNKLDAKKLPAQEIRSKEGIANDA
jgi:nicotinamidase-related amidase